VLSFKYGGILKRVNNQRNLFAIIAWLLILSTAFHLPIPLHASEPEKIVAKPVDTKADLQFTVSPPEEPGANHVSVEVTVRAEGAHNVPSLQHDLAVRLGELKTNGVPVKAIIASTPEHHGQDVHDAAQILGEIGTVVDTPVVRDLPANWTEKTEEVVPEWGDLSLKDRLSDALVVLSIDGVVTFGVLILTRHAPFWASTKMGIIMGAMTAFLAFNGPQWRKLILNSSIGKALKRLMPLPEVNLPFGEQLEALAKWTVVDLLMVMVGEIALDSFGLPAEQAIAWTVVGDLLTEYPFELWTMMLSKRMKRAIRHSDLSIEDKHAGVREAERRTNMDMRLVCAVGAAISMLQLTGFNCVWLVIAGISVVGFAGFGRALFQKDPGVSQCAGMLEKKGWLARIRDAWRFKKRSTPSF
jgi:hypothetical protein